jgi:putative DNA primase/helicase
MSRTVDEKPPPVIVDQPNPKALRGYEHGQLNNPLGIDRECALLPLTDLGNAWRFLARNKREFLWCPAVGWLAWDGRRYALDAAQGQLSRAIHETISAIKADAIRGTDADHPVGATRDGQVRTYADLVHAWGKTSQGAPHVSCVSRMAAPISK